MGMPLRLSVLITYLVPTLAGALSMAAGRTASWRATSHCRSERCEMTPVLGLDCLTMQVDDASCVGAVCNETL
jgi:hypothetical protein